MANVELDSPSVLLASLPSTDIGLCGNPTFYSSKFSRGLQCIFTQWLVIIGLETLEDADSLDV